MHNSYRVVGTVKQNENQHKNKRKRNASKDLLSSDRLGAAGWGALWFEITVLGASVGGEEESATIISIVTKYIYTCNDKTLKGSRLWPPRQSREGGGKIFKGMIVFHLQEFCNIRKQQ